VSREASEQNAAAPPNMGFATHSVYPNWLKLTSQALISLSKIGIFKIFDFLG
jgi:hypothetical protein